MLIQLVCMQYKQIPVSEFRNHLYNFTMLLANCDENCRKIMSQKSSEVFYKMLASEYTAEQFISSLPKREQDLIQSYIDNLIDMFNTDKPFLYKQDIFDGIRLIKFVMAL